MFKKKKALALEVVVEPLLSQTVRRAYADRSVHRRSEDASPVSGVELRAPPRFPPARSRPRRHVDWGGGGGETRERRGH